jgi:pheromone shutdown-related protein TraB
MKTETSTIIYDSTDRTSDTSIDKGKIILVGTAHVSEKSVNEVNEVIEREKPDIVAVELCKARYNALKGKEEVKEVNIKNLLSGNKFYHFLMHWLLAYVQKKFGKEQGIKPGAEMLSAIEKTEKINAHLALIDRDIQITIARFWNKMSLFEKLKIFVSLIGATFGKEEIDMNEVTDEDVVSQLVSELRKFAPTAASVLLDERNAIMAKNLIDLSREGKVVAVVGAGHREGIRNYLDAPESIPPIEELLVLQKKRFSWFKAAAIGLSLMIIGFLALLVYSGTISLMTLLTMLLILFITKGILSAAGVILARGHSFSILTAFSLAWSGFLHPWLPVGWLAGIVEAHYRPPMTEDFKNIMKTETLNELMQNKLFRILLVAGLANFGSMLGTLVAIPVIVHYLGISNPLEIFKTALTTGINLVENIL